MKRAWKAVLAGLFVAAMAMPASAAISGPQTFEGFTPGTPLQPAAGSGWTYTGGASYDVGITEAADGIGDTQSLRISNGTMSGSFGDWVFSPVLTQAATDTGLQEFTAEFDIESVTGTNQGMSMNVAPQTAGGARMSNLRFQDGADGIHVLFSDVLNPSGTIDFQNSPFRTVDIATLSYVGVHNVKIVMNLIPGPHNDVVQVYIDGSAGLVPGRPGQITFDGFYAPVDNPEVSINRAKAGQTIPMKWRLSAPSFATTWEDYYRYDKESNGGSGAADPVDTVNGYGTRDVDSLIIQARCAAAGPCANALAQGKGYLIDNVSYESAALGTPLPITSVGVSDASVYGPGLPFTLQGLNCNALDDLTLDAIETYAPGATGLAYHGNGVWQYNFQTQKAWAGKCVQWTLNYADEPALFQFTK
jgi:hypothetical protein